MPKIPVYNGNKVENQITPGGQISPGIADASGVIGFGQTVQRAGGAVGDYAQKVKREADETAFYAAMTKIGENDAALSLEAKAKRGEDFIKARPEYDQRRSQFVQGVLEGLPASVKDKVQQVSDRSGIGFKTSLDEHLVAQQTVIDNASAQSAIKTAIDHGSKAPADTVVSDQLTGMAVSSLEPTLRGLPEQVKAQKRAEVMAAVISARIHGFLAAENGAADAKKLFDTNEEVLKVSGDYLKLKNIVNHEVDFATAKDLSQSYAINASTMKVDEKTGIGTYDWSGQRNALMESIKDKPEKFREQTLQMFDVQHQQWDIQHRANIDTAQAAVSQIAGQSGPWAALSSRQLAAMIANPDTAEAGFKLQHELKRMSHDLTTMSRENLAAKYAANMIPYLTNPELQANLDATKITNLIPLIGPENAKWLAGTVGRLDGSTSIPVPPDILNAEIARGKYNMKDQTVAGRVKQAYETSTNELLELKKGGTKITRELIQSTLRQNLASFDTVTEEMPWYRPNKTGKMPWGSMTPKQQEEAVKRLDPTEKREFADWARVVKGVTQFSSQEAYMKIFSAWKSEGKPKAPASATAAPSGKMPSANEAPAILPW